nr:hypothetical protein [Gammaproteobacteria bacterium]
MGTDAMFSIETRKDPLGRVMVVGKATRKYATSFLNIPISAEARERLSQQVVGSLAMGTGALLEWALDELERQGISLEARPRP